MAKNTKKWSLNERIFLVLIILVLVLGSLNMAKARGWLIPEQPQLEITDNVVDLEEMALEQKIAQMVIVHGGKHNLEAWKNLQVGGIHLFAMKKASLFTEIIGLFQQGMAVPFFVTVDLEGCWNPFSSFRNFTAVSEISSVEEAYQKGVEEGQFLSSLGVNLNFAPVVDLEDEIWKCRAFPGEEEEVSVLAEAYINGLQSEKVLATAKHYPGKALVVKDPHKEIVVADISAEDVYPYSYLAENGSEHAAMVTHVISTGEVDSNGKPSVTSKQAVDELKERFSGLVITDDIMMLGLKDFFGSNEEMYKAVFKAGNDLVINFNEDPNEIYLMIEVVKEAVLAGEIPEQQIDDSVTKILEAKGFTVE